METISRTPTTRRTFRTFRERRTVFEPMPRKGHSVGAVLTSLPANVERVYLVGRPIGGAEATRRFAAPSPNGQRPTGLPAGWSVSERGHYLEGDLPTFRFVAPDGHEVEIHRAAAFFGEGDYDASTATVAWVSLRDEIRRDFRDAPLLSSPASAGRELLLRALPRDTEWPTLPDDLQQLIRSTSGQGRIQVIDRGPRDIVQLLEYDGRLMYAALCWGLPGPGGRLVRCSEYLGQTRARYLATATVPRDWRTACRCGAPGHDGIGCLGFAPPDRSGWQYPAQPGETFNGWWDGAELHVALQHGWRFTFHEALVFDNYTGAGPLDVWAKKLVSVRDRLALRGPNNRPAQLAANAVRAIMLHAIGALHGSAQRVTRSVPIDRAGEVPADARDLRVEGDQIVWAEYGGPGWPAMSHPEWTAAIWARARARLLQGPAQGEWKRTGALHVPALHVIGFRTDALYLSAEDPEWHDDGAVGRLRLAGQWTGPMRAPRTNAELLRAAA